MSKMYQNNDKPTFNYNLWLWNNKLGMIDNSEWSSDKLKVIKQTDWPEQGHWLRGPKPTGKRECVSIIGSSGTFGRFVNDSFANMIESKLNLDVYNLIVYLKR